MRCVFANPLTPVEPTGNKAPGVGVANICIKPVGYTVALPTAYTPSETMINGEAREVLGVAYAGRGMVLTMGAAAAPSFKIGMNDTSTNAKLPILLTVHSKT